MQFFCVQWNITTPYVSDLCAFKRLNNGNEHWIELSQMCLHIGADTPLNDCVGLNHRALGHNHGAAAPPSLSSPAPAGLHSLTVWKIMMCSQSSQSWGVQASVGGRMARNHMITPATEWHTLVFSFGPSLAWSHSCGWCTHEYLKRR